MAIRIQIRRATAGNWTINNPTLEQGELGYETDTYKLKIGRGLSWNNTPYFFESASSGIGNLANLLTTAKSTIVDAINELYQNKVDKEEGKELSSNDFTDAYRAQLDNLEATEYEFDSEPTLGSLNPVTSDGIKTYVDRLRSIEGDPYWEYLERAYGDAQTIASYIDTKISESTQTPPLPSGTFWEQEPDVILSGVNKEIVDVTYGELSVDGEIIPYPAKQFTATLPTSPNLRQDAVEALSNGTYNLKAGTPGTSVTRPSLTEGAVWVRDITFTPAGGAIAETGKVASVQVIEDGIAGPTMTGNVKVNLGSVVPQTLTDSSTVTFSGQLSSKAVLHAPTQLLVLVFSFTRLGHEYLIRVTQANGLHVVLSPLDGVTFKDIAGNAITSIDLPFGDCRILYEHTSDTERTVQVIDGLDGESSGAVEQGWRLQNDITVEVDSNDILTTGAGTLIIDEVEHAFIGNNFGAVTRPASGFYRVISVVAAYNTTYGATVQLMGGSKDMKDPRRTALPSNVLWIRDVIITATSVVYGDAGYLTKAQADLLYAPIGSSGGAGSVVTDSTVNGNIRVDNAEVQVWDNSQNALKSELHSHANKAALDKITDAGNGAAFLANDGTYKAVSSGGSTVTDSATNGNIVVDGAQIQVWDNTSNLTKTEAASSYEPKIATKNTAFNKDFGSAAGTVAEGNHTHTGYQATATTASLGTAGTWALTLDKDKELYAGTLTGNITITAASLTVGMVQAISFAANGSATVTLPAGAVNEGTKPFVNSSGTGNRLWFRVGLSTTGAVTLFYKWG